MVGIASPAVDAHAVCPPVEIVSRVVGRLGAKLSGSWTRTARNSCARGQGFFRPVVEGEGCAFAALSELGMAGVGGGGGGGGDGGGAVTRGEDDCLVCARAHVLIMCLFWVWALGLGSPFWLAVLREDA